jgi:16S rRNA (adenine1518-N6/adenine1519-N6)-dimethyltransferase
LKTGAKVIAVEKDRRIVEDLKKDFPNIELIEGDILEFVPNNWNLEYKNYKIVANLPYYITSHFIRTVLEEWPPPNLMVLMVQKEVAQRIISQPPHMNLLALSVQAFADVKIITHVAKGNFRPEPSVDSSVIKLVLKDNPNTKFLALAKNGFASKRKTLSNNLNNYISKDKLSEILKILGLREDIRAENLSIEDWQRLFDKIG